MNLKKVEKYENGNLKTEGKENGEGPEVIVRHLDWSGIE